MSTPVDTLIADAEAVADTGARMGRLPLDSRLPGLVAEAKTAAQAGSLTEAQVADLRVALNAALPALHPVSLDDLRRGWRPYEQSWRNWIGVSLFGVIGLVLLVFTGMSTLVYEKARNLLLMTEELQNAKAEELAAKLYFIAYRSREKSIFSDVNDPNYDLFIKTAGDLQRISTNASALLEINSEISQDIERILAILYFSADRQRLAMPSEGKTYAEQVAELATQYGLDANLQPKAVPAFARAGTSGTDLAWLDSGAIHQTEGSDLVRRGRPLSAEPAGAGGPEQAKTDPETTPGYTLPRRPKFTVGRNAIGLPAKPEVPAQPAECPLPMAQNAPLHCAVEAHFVAIRKLMEALNVSIDPRYPGNLLAHIYQQKARVGALGLWILPALYGMLGAMTFHMRRLLDSNVPNPPVLSFIFRIVAGGFAGVIVGWFWSYGSGATGLPAFVSVGAFGVAFLVGFSTEILFGLLERLTTWVSGTFTKPAAAA